MTPLEQAREALKWALKTGRLDYVQRTKSNGDYCDGVDRVRAALASLEAAGGGVEPTITSDLLERLAIQSGLDEELWFGKYTPRGYEDTLPKLERFARAVLSTAAPDAERYRWILSPDADARNANSEQRELIYEAFRQLTAEDMDEPPPKAQVDAAVDAAMQSTVPAKPSAACTYPRCGCEVNLHTMAGCAMQSTNGGKP